MSKTPIHNIKHSDWPEYVGKRLEFKKGNEIITGILKRIDKESIGAAEPGVKPPFPWLIQTDRGDQYSLYPEDRWEISLIG